MAGRKAADSQQLSADRVRGGTSRMCSGSSMYGRYGRRGLKPASARPDRYEERGMKVSLKLVVWLVVVRRNSVTQCSEDSGPTKNTVSYSQ